MWFFCDNKTKSLLEKLIIKRVCVFLGGVCLNAEKIVISKVPLCLKGSMDRWFGLQNFNSSIYARC